MPSIPEECVESASTFFVLLSRQVLQARPAACKYYRFFNRQRPVYGGCQTHITMENYQHLQQQTGWSDAIFRAIGSEAEARIYIKAGLQEKTVNGRPALVNPAIDGRAFNCRKEWLREKLADYDRWKDWNNADLMGEGYPPRDDNGDPFELHHIGQHQDSPFAELTWAQHMGGGNNAILHPQRESEIDRPQFEGEKAAHWMARFEDFKQTAYK